MDTQVEQDFKANRERVLEHSRNIYHRDIEKNHERAKAYYLKNREAIIARQINHRKEAYMNRKETDPWFSSQSPLTKWLSEAK